ncbi:hypothetical protein XMV225_002328 [Aliiroseovarius sp. xm-v-225]|nr:hypothetical protein [Aliiroseovarius sp. xm-m-378]NRP50945.1 hypothetical protein [Aliiroseovarius sp. xm-m-354]NRP66022.1 hypothetical protein [Aliiroseovarius sp. xm-v-225]NRP92838.1 hypothetical protein [Aliiroseovarius sp. xm-a-134]NRQ05697.1 hypothetical protein [Aliiroseovarius sp. xm-m-309]NRQ26895.1 hypothetical protein [Aliiroseovarius sp. xm-g-7]
MIFLPRKPSCLPPESSVGNQGGEGLNVCLPPGHERCQTCHPFFDIRR